ncbi:MAG: ATP-binding domain-containing protein, partial [Muribaculaceae bacterium]|nr:ATP-binding domain-containing protein [Muribaculaceae bacterium]
MPPVGCEESPAMNVEVLKSYGLHVTRAIMTETVRQGRESGILYNATRLRRSMRLEQLPAPRLLISPFDDVLSLSGEYLAESLGDAYGRDGVGQTILITRSNKRATDFNLAIRSNILYREEELCRDELLLVAKNNYFWSKEVKGLDFIANGDVAVVVKVYGTERRYGCRFADVKLYLPDRDVELDCKIMLDTLVSESASMSREDMTSLFESIIKDPLDEETSDATRAANALKSPYFNALQVKYGYAVTCHKAQGGQWRNVYVDMGHIPAEAMGMDFY